MSCILPCILNPISLLFSQIPQEPIMKKIIFIIALSIFSLLAQAERPMVIYYESWSGNPSAQDIKELPPYVTHLMISFAKPDAIYTGNLDLSTSGLNLPYSGSTLKDAIKVAKQHNPKLKVLLAVGGATYHHWESINAKALSQLVVDLELDGIDIDYEAPEPNAELVNNITQILRDALPSDKTLTMAVMHVAAYGQDEWTHSQPTGSIWTGFFHKISDALKQIDMINVMSYDAGSSYDVLEAYAAFNYYYNGVIAMGMQVPPEAWGDHVWTVNKVESIAQEILTTREHDGLMLWSMHKNNDEVSDTNPDYPSANLLAISGCHELMLASIEICNLPLIDHSKSTLTFRNDSHQNGIYFVVDAMPYGYPRTETMNIGAEATLTGTEIPITTEALPIYVYIGYETPCINADNGSALTLNWTPENMSWRVNFWMDNNNRPLCSAAR